MELEVVNRLIKEFCKETHGATNYSKEVLFVKGQEDHEFVPLKFLAKKIEGLSDEKPLMAQGYTYCSHDFIDGSKFNDWYEAQFSKKLVSKDILVLVKQNANTILHALEVITQGYEVLRNAGIILNGKNMPVQLGEWYAKCIFGLHQVRSSSQRGFDFELKGKRVEVVVDWGDATSPKGVKIKKSLIELSEYLIVIYIKNNMLIREICFLDSEFVSRKFEDRGDTIFLKDVRVSPYFFSKSSKQFEWIVDKTSLMKFACPNFALNLVGRAD